MALDDIVRSAVGIANRQTAGLQGTVTHRIRTVDARGGTATASTKKRKGLIEDRTRRFQKDGVEVVSRTKLTFLSAVPVGDNDEFVLPSGETVVVLQVDKLVDPKASGGGGYLTEVWLGANDQGIKRGV